MSTQRTRFMIIAAAVVAVSTVALFAQAPAPPPGGHHPPHADPGPNQRVGIHTGDHVSITLDGSKSSDPDPDDILTYVWTDQAGHVLNGDPDVPTAHVLINAAGSYTYTLTVTDPAGASNSNSLLVEVIVDTDPP